MCRNLCYAAKVAFFRHSCCLLPPVKVQTGFCRRVRSCVYPTVQNSQVISKLFFFNVELQQESELCLMDIFGKPFHLLLTVQLVSPPLGFGLRHVTIYCLLTAVNSEETVLIKTFRSNWVPFCGGLSCGVSCKKTQQTTKKNII